MASQNKSLAKYLPAGILNKYDVFNYRNAAEVLATSAKGELRDLIEALTAFSLTVADIRKPGGNESDIPKRVSAVLRPKGWLEVRIKGDLTITKVSGRSRIPVREDEEDGDVAEIEALEADALTEAGAHVERVTRKNFLDGHKVDYVKNRVAFDVEWNSKDQTFDRDLYAFRAFHDCDLIDVGVVLTRSADLNEVFDKLGAELDADGKPRLDAKTSKPKLLKTKYGASTTWMGKLLYRLDAGRQGGCPVLALGITRRLIQDWKD